jgi:ribosomal protein S18 acetylase RimI-like enzyme
MTSTLTLGGVTADDVKASFRGEIYGAAGGMTDDWFRDHVRRNDVDLTRSLRWSLDGALCGAALLAFRGERAWVGAFGVVPEFRGRGLASRHLDETVAVARDAGATSVELEVLSHNSPAIRLYERGGFSHLGEIVVWSRAPAGRRSPAKRAAAAVDGNDLAAVTALARTPSTCWQREPRGVAAAAPFETLVSGAAEAPRAYAFVRRRRTSEATLLDAGASDPASANALLDALDATYVAETLMFVNEPPHGPLHDALLARESWREFARQHRMRIDLR